MKITCCRYCKERTARCHTYCKKYSEERALLDIEREKERDAKEYEIEQTKYRLGRAASQKQRNRMRRYKK